MTKRKLILIILFLPFCIFYLSAQTTKEYPIQTIAQLEDSINKIMINEHQASLMLAILSKDSIVFSDGLGITNIDTKRKATSQTLFPMASITKTFTALAIMELVKQGKLSLSEDLSKIAPEIGFINKWEKESPVKIIHLLEHTSGFDDLRFNTFWNNDLNITELQAIEKCKTSMYCRWRPGEREAYSNIGYNILGYLVEKLSGLRYEVFLKKEILLPIGMTNSNFIIPTKQSSIYATPYEWDGNSYKRLPFLQMMGKGSGALYSCADDMAKFVKFMLNNGNTGSLPGLHSIIEQMEIPESTPAAKLGLKTGYGKGITVNFLNYNYPFWGHDGAGIGFNSLYAYNRELKAGFVICCSNPGSISDVLVHYLTASLQIPKPIPTIPLNIEILRSYEGYYQLKSPRFDILNKYLEELFHGYHIELKHDRLHSYGFKRPDQVLLPVTSAIFRKTNENLPSFLFTTNQEGKKVLYEWGAYYERTSFVQILINRIVVLGSLVCGILLVFSSMLWFFKAIFKRLTWKEYGKRSLSAFGFLSLIISFATLAFMATNVALMATMNFFTITFFSGTILFAVLCIAGFVLTVKRLGQIVNKSTKWYLLITSTWLLALVFFYFHYDWIGLKMWSY